MLCIALMAVFAFDVAEAGAPCADTECSAACDLGACDHQDEDGAPCVKHHCCHGTVASVPNVEGANLSSANFCLAPIAADTFVVSSYIDALERPPRPSTAI